MAMATGFDDETLMAFTDGALPDPDRRRVADAVAASPELAARVAALRAGAAAAKAHFGPLADAPLPAALEARVRAMIAAAPPTAAAPSIAKAAPSDRAPGEETSSGKTPPSTPADATVVPLPVRQRPTWLPTAIAAGLAAIVFGGIGFALGGAGRGDPPAVAALPAGLLAVLDGAATGTTTPLADGGDAVVLASVVDARGRLCREVDLSGPAPATLIACRDGARFVVDLLVARGSAGADYVPASATATVDAHLAEIGAGAPLDPAEEARLLRP